jgi:hypothetical protein
MKRGDDVSLRGSDWLTILSYSFDDDASHGMAEENDGLVGSAGELTTETVVSESDQVPRSSRVQHLPVCLRRGSPQGYEHGGVCGLWTDGRQ